MDIGMLWFDSNQAKAVTERVELAANYYKQKYGRVATLCFVHPSAVAEPSKVGHTEIQPMDTVQPNHFWLGIKPEANEVEDEAEKPANVTKEFGRVKQVLEISASPKGAA